MTDFNFGNFINVVHGRGKRADKSLYSVPAKIHKKEKN
jgi:hypothetical protein